MNSRGFALLTEAKILQPDNLRRWELENWDELISDDNEPDFICLMCETCRASARVNDYTDSEWDEAVWTADDVGTFGDIWEDEGRAILMSDITKYREIVYEVGEKEGKYYCLIYAHEEGTALFKNGYFSSPKRAITAAKKFIDDYYEYSESKENE
jgi:hypothetical protein